MRLLSLLLFFCSLLPGGQEQPDQQSQGAERSVPVPSSPAPEPAAAQASPRGKREQIGQPARKVSPEIVHQIERAIARTELGGGLTPEEIRELRALKDADSQLLSHIVETDKHYRDLLEYVKGLDASVDQKLIAQAVADIASLKKESQDRDQDAREDRRSTQQMVNSVKTGVIVLLIGMAIHWLKWALFDTKRRRKLLWAMTSQMTNQTEDIKRNCKTCPFNPPARQPGGRGAEEDEESGGGAEWGGD